MRASMVQSQIRPPTKAGGTMKGSGQDRSVTGNGVSFSMGISPNSPARLAGPNQTTIAHILAWRRPGKKNHRLLVNSGGTGFNRRMRILPVLDLMKRLVVRAQGGRRKEYRPLTSGLIRSSHPLDVAQAFRFHFGLKELYLADLDAIAGRLPALDTFVSLRQRGFRLWLEAGIRQAQDAEQLAQTGVDTIVAGLETVAGPEVLGELCRKYSPARIVFSLDLKDGQPFGEPKIWGAEPMEIVRRAVACGIQRILVLDLARVGGGKGLGTEDLLRQIAAEFPKVELSAGGGVRGPDDLASLKQTGIQVALVASALHDGRLKRSDLDAVA